MKQLIRKKSLLGLSLFVLSLCASFSHSDEIVDFSNGLPNGMSIGGAMSDAFPGYITDNQYDKSSSIVFANPTPVSSFELNPLPYEGYPFDIVLSDYQIKGIDAEGNVAFELEVDLSGYTDWETWLTVQVDNSIAITELVFGPAVTEMFPSIDNLVVDLANEVDDVDADFAEYNCQVYGNCGDNDSEVEPFEDAIFVCEYGCDDEEFVAYNCEVYGVCLDNDATSTETSADSQTETQIELNTNTNTDPVIFTPTTSGSAATPETEFGYQVVDFSNGLPNGMSIGGAMSDAFPGYITDNQYDKSSSIVFANPTPVSSFELNPLPYEGYPFDIVLSDYQIKGIDAEGNVAFELEVDLSGYTDWETWLTVQVDNSIAITELVFGPAVTEMFPSIDNLVVGLANEVDDVDADFAEYNCQVYGNCGDNDSEVEPFEDAIFVCEYGCDDEEFVAYNCEVYGVCLDNDATNTETSADSQTETQIEINTNTDPVIFTPTTSGSAATPETEFGYQVVDFSNGLPNGMSIGGAMLDAFPGYINDNQYNKSSSIVFTNPTPVSSFELNPLPYAGYPFDIVLSDYQIKGIDAEGNVAFELEVDLSGYTDWETWLTVQVDNSIAITELVFGPAVTEMYPSIDNLVVGLANEVDDVDADFAEYNCQVYGNCGDNDSEVEPFEDAIFVCEYGCDDEEFVAYNCEVYGVCLDNDVTNTETSADSQTETQTNSDTTTEPEFGYQLVSVEGNPIAQLNDTLEISISYDVSDDNNSLSGLGFNIHYDSSVLSFNEFIYLLADDSIISSVSVDDIDDLDNDSSTDKYISLGWASFFSAWPGFLPQSLASISFNVTEQTDLQLTPINFSATGTAAGYSFSAENYAVEVINGVLDVDDDTALAEQVLNATWDIDGNGRADALTDGLMLLKASFGFTGEALIDGTLAADSGMTLEDVEANMENTMTIADIDGDGEVNALTDGVILLRYLFGITDSTLTEGAIGPNAQRDTHQSIVDYLDENMPETE